jgi:hypothetical protein
VTCIDYIIQHHPSRSELVKRLTCDLPDARLIVSDETPPNPWGGYMKCLASVRRGYSHVCIIQDDAVVCRNLPRAVELIAAAEPHVPIVLYLGMLPPNKLPALKAGKEGKRFVDLLPSSFMPVVAVLWPAGLAAEFLAWSGNPELLRRRNGLSVNERSDDAMAGRWMRQTRQRVVATIPSLVEHPDDAPSTIGRNPGGRTALFWHGVEWDALSVEWG